MRDFWDYIEERFIPEIAFKTILEKSKDFTENVEIFVIGGSVRDYIINKTFPNEIDLLVTGWELKPLLQLLNRFGAAVYVGSSFGVIKFVYNGNVSDISLPSIRGSGNSVIEDLKNRDFSINSIALKYPSLEIIDPLNGLLDIEKKEIRETSKDAFAFDPIRTIRAIRFSVQLGFKIEENTLANLIDNIENLWSVSPERIRDEINKILTRIDKPSEAFLMLRDLGILKIILPELDNCFGCAQEGGWHIYDVFEHSIYAIDEAPKNDLLLRLSLLLHDIGKPPKKYMGEEGRAHFTGHARESAYMAKRRLKALKYSNEIINNVFTIIDNHMTHLPETIKGKKRLIRRLGEENVNRFITHRLADLHAMDFEQVRQEIEDNIQLGRELNQIIDEKPPMSVLDLDIDGKQLMSEFNLVPGPIIGKILEHLLDKILENPDNNSFEKLIQIAAEFLEPK